MGEICDSIKARFFLAFRLGIIIAILIINCEFLIPIIKNSKKEDPYQEFEIDYSGYYGLGTKCDYLTAYHFLEKGAYENFKLKIKALNIISIGLICIMFIQLALEFMFFVVFFNSCCFSETTFGKYSFFYLISFGIMSILHLLFFILFLIFYFIAEIKEFRDFSECNLFNQRLKETYNYIFIIFEKAKSFSISDAAFIFFVIILFICQLIKNNN